MGLFKDVFCSECGIKTKMLTRTHLKDDRYLCYKCSSCVPGYMQKSFVEGYTLEDYRNFKKYIEFSNEVLRPKFRETHSYDKIHIDTENYIFCMDYFIDDKTLFFGFEDVTRFNLIFMAEEFKEGMFGDKVRGKVLFELAMDCPPFYNEEVLISDAKVSAKKKLFGRKVEYDNPEGMDEFVYFFKRTWEEALEIAQYKEDADKTVGASELQQAMALFMIDNLDEITPEELKNLRNKLIKTFHPDEGETEDVRQVQKINTAYDIIKNAIR